MKMDTICKDYPRVCSGCMACVAVCPKECICIDTQNKRRCDIKIDEKKCIKCGLCWEVCPHNTTNNVYYNPIKGVNAIVKNRKIIRNCSSGGIATAIYKHCIKHGIKGFGVNFDDTYHLKYKIIDDETCLLKAMGSKYVFSNMGGFLRRFLSH